MCSETRPPEEGLDTLSAQFTYEAVHKVVTAIKALRQKGLSEEAITEKISRELRQFDAHSRQRMYDKSLDSEIADDFPAEDVESEESPKKNTLVLKLKKAPPGIEEQMLVQYKAEDYYVSAVSGLVYTLKKLVPRARKK